MPNPKPIALYGWKASVFRALTPALLAVSSLRRKVRSRSDRAQQAGSQLEAFESNVSSQQGEDGILKEIFFRLGSQNRYFVEFGVQDGSECNTALLAGQYGWGGLYIEANPKDAAVLRERWSDRNDVTVREAFVSAENIAALFAEANVPSEPDLLSIDIDGNDYWVWKALADYRPRVVVIEYNAAYVPPRRWIMKYDPQHVWDGTTHFGASLSAYADLGSELGYSLIGTDSHGVNAFFIRRDLLGASKFAEVKPEEAYHRARHGMLALPHPYRPGPFVGDDSA